MHCNGQERKMSRTLKCSTVSSVFALASSAISCLFTRLETEFFRYFFSSTCRLMICILYIRKSLSETKFLMISANEFLMISENVFCKIMTRPFYVPHFFLSTSLIFSGAAVQLIEQMLERERNKQERLK